MKKLLLIVIFILLFSTTYVSASTSNDLYEEREYSIDFDSLSNKSLNYVFSNLDVFMVSITINVGNYTNTYMINTYLDSDIEREITRRIVSDLISDNKREIATTVEYKGYTISNAKLLITKYTYNKIVERVKSIN